MYSAAINVLIEMPEAMTGYLLSVSSTTQLHNVTQSILWIHLCEQSLVTLVFTWVILWLFIISSPTK